MSEFKFSCPFCGQNFESEDEYIGQKATCPTCGNEITIQPPDANDAESPRADESDRCPYCAGSVQQEAIKCPHCGENIFRCPQCGRRGTMDYHESAMTGVKSLGGGVVGAIAGGILLGPIGAILCGIGGASTGKPSGYLKCRICGHVI